ncbi:MAG: tetratricopeptide repeat protein [Pseudomonadota bacterium]
MANSSRNPKASKATSAQLKSADTSAPATVLGPSIPSRFDKFLGKLKGLKGVVVAIAGVGAVASGLVGYYTTYKTVISTQASASVASVAKSASDSNAIAVLPFVNMSDDKANEYFSDGLSEELLNMLAKLPQLRVIARTSSFAFKGKESSVAQIAKTLGVAHILEGSVRKSGNTLRITTQLIRTSDSAQLWSETYDRQMTDVFKTQDEIASAVVAALKIRLLPEQQVTNKYRTTNTEAYLEYLLGNQFISLNTPDGHRRAVKAYSAALALDPAYAAAYAGLAFAEHEAFRFNDQPMTPDEVAQAKLRAIAAAEKAIALAPDLALGYAARGFIRTFTLWDWNGALKDEEKALSLDASDSTIERRYGLLLAIMGKLPEAITSTKRALEIDPLSMFAWSNLGSYYNSTGQLAEADKALHRALDISPSSHHASGYLGQNALLGGRPADALPFYQHAGEIHKLAGTAMAEHSLGHAQKSQQSLDELIAKHSQDRAFRIGLVYAWRGEADKAFAWLDRALKQKDTDLAYIKYEPLLAPIRKDPRFAVMVKKIGLPD